MSIDKEKLSKWCTKLADSFVDSGFFKYSQYFIGLFIVVSASTEIAFLYMDTIEPLVTNPIISGLITLVFVAAIEGLNYFGLKSSLVAGKLNGWSSFLIIFVCVYATAKTVSLNISVGGAIAAVEIKNVVPYELQDVYKDSIASYYTEKIEDGKNSPREANAANITTLNKMSESILKEIKAIRDDKGNYTHDNIFFVKAQSIVAKKELSLEKIRESISKIMLNDSGVINATSENEKLRKELQAKLNEIKANRKKFNDNLNDKNEQAFYVILFVEFFSFILNLMRTFTGIYKSRSKEDDLKDKERQLKEDEKGSEIESRIKLMQLRAMQENDSVIQAKQDAIIRDYKNKTIKRTPAKQLIGQLYGNKEINDKKFTKMIANDEIKQYSNK